MIVVVDASVAVKWVLPEFDSGHATALRKPEDDLIAPSLVAAELGDAIWKSALRGNLTKSDAHTALQTAVAHFSLLVPIEDLAARAIDIAIALAHPVYDCFYLALAEREGAPVVTADDRLLAAAKRLKGVSVKRLSGVSK